VDLNCSCLVRLLQQVGPLLRVWCLCCRANTKLFELSIQVAEASRKLTLLFKLCCRANTTTGKPRAGSNVTIPFGWNLVIDESPPPLYMLVIEVCVYIDVPALLPTTQHTVNVQHQVLARCHPLRLHTCSS
jgi:hypothetical protein